MRRQTAWAAALLACTLGACVPQGGPTASPTPSASPSAAPTSAEPSPAASSAEDESPTPEGPELLRIGVPVDHPGLGTVLGTGPSGFEPALAEEIAERLGLEPLLVPVDLDQRIRALTEGEVGMLLHSLSHNAETAAQIEIAGPYLVVRQDLLMAAGESEWEGATLCGVQGTEGLTRAQRLYADETLIYPAQTYGGCVEMLANGTVAVVAGDDAVLAGFAARNPGRMSLVGAELAVTRYAVGLPPDSGMCEEVNEALAAIVEDGTWAELAERHLGPAFFPDATLNPPAPAECTGS